MDELLSRLEAAADPGAAVALARYFQVRPGGYGDGDVFLGIKLSELRRLARPYAHRPFTPADWLTLLRSPVHEHRLITLVVMSARAGRGDEEERSSLYRTYLSHTEHIDNWDLVDVSAAAVVGGHLVDRDRASLYDLARSGLVWERRIAIVSTHYFLRAGDAADAYALASILLADRHDLIHKAVGWTLREAGRRVDAEELRQFLELHAAAMPRTALRYAIEHFAPAERDRYRALGRTPAAGRSVSG